MNNLELSSVLKKAFVVNGILLQNEVNVKEGHIALKHLEIYLTRL